MEIAPSTIRQTNKNVPSRGLTPGPLLTAERLYRLYRNRGCRVAHPQVAAAGAGPLTWLTDTMAVPPVLPPGLQSSSPAGGSSGHGASLASHSDPRSRRRAPLAWSRVSTWYPPGPTARYIEGASNYGQEKHDRMDVVKHTSRSQVPMRDKWRGSTLVAAGSHCDRPHQSRD